MKATHSGHCQACGHLQKLPKGKLSKHGYNVAYGFFSGICAGAAHLPYEQSCELIKRFIASAEQDLDRVLETQAQLRSRATEPKAWVRIYERNAGRGRGEYRWRLREVTQESSATGHFEFFHYAPTEGADGIERNPRNREISAPSGYWAKGTDILDACTHANAKYAGWMEFEVLSLRRYIAWQTDRVTGWKLAELTPVPAEGLKDDGQGFMPEEPAY